MSITDTSKIDIVTINDDEVVLVITDHLNWDGHTDDEHMLLLQEKLNTYLRFFESNEIYDQFPNAKGKEVKIEINFKYPLNQSGDWFIEQVIPAIESAGLGLETKIVLDD